MCPNVLLSLFNVAYFIECKWVPRILSGEGVGLPFDELVFTTLNTPNKIFLDSLNSNGMYDMPTLF